MSQGYSLKNGQTLFKEGSYSDSAFIIESGKIEVSKVNGIGEKIVIGVLEQSEIIGEMGLIDGQSRSATAIALGDTKVREITKEQFEFLSNKNPEAIMPILKVLSKRLRQVLKTFVDTDQNKLSKSVG